jgi:hypothetical protein
MDNMFFNILAIFAEFETGLTHINKTSLSPGDARVFGQTRLEIEP